MSDLKGLYIDEELHKKIKQLAAKDGATIKAMVEKILTQELEERRKKDGDGGSTEGTDRGSRRR